MYFTVLYCTCNVTFRNIRVTIVAVEKYNLLHVVSVFVAFQHAMRMRHIIICDMLINTTFLPPHYLIDRAN
jgi:hypothetical protein